MRKASLSGIFCLVILLSFAQSSPVKEIDQLNPPGQALAPLRFLTSDELIGRVTMRPEIHVAARCISEQLKHLSFTIHIQHLLILTI